MQYYGNMDYAITLLFGRNFQIYPKRPITIYQTWAVIWKSSGIAAANRYSGRYSVADSGMGQVNSVAGIAGFGKNHNGPARILIHQTAAHYTW